MTLRILETGNGMERKLLLIPGMISYVDRLCNELFPPSHGSEGGFSRDQLSAKWFAYLTLSII